MVANNRWYIRGLTPTPQGPKLSRTLTRTPRRGTARRALLNLGL